MSSSSSSSADSKRRRLELRRSSTSASRNLLEESAASASAAAAAAARGDDDISDDALLAMDVCSPPAAAAAAAATSGARALVDLSSESDGDEEADIHDRVRLERAGFDATSRVVIRNRESLLKHHAWRVVLLNLPAKCWRFGEHKGALFPYIQHGNATYRFDASKHHPTLLSKEDAEGVVLSDWTDETIAAARERAAGLSSSAPFIAKRAAGSIGGAKYAIVDENETAKF